MSYDKYTLIAYEHDYYEILVQRYKDQEPKKHFLEPCPYTDKEKQRIVMSRAKQKLKEYCFNNNFEFFVTLTINSINCDRYSLVACQNKMKKIFKSIKRKFYDFKYVIITEQHKDGAFHFHGLIKGIPENHIYINKNGYLYLEEFNQLGFNSLIPFDNNIKFVNYIMKYISKNPIKDTTNHIYFASRGLKTSDRFELKSLNVDSFPHVWENEYIKKSGFYYNELHYKNRLDLLMSIKNIDNKKY